MISLSIVTVFFYVLNFSHIHGPSSLLYCEQVREEHLAQILHSRSPVILSQLSEILLDLNSP